MAHVKFFQIPKSWSSKILPWARGFVLLLVVFSIAMLLLNIGLFILSGKTNLSSIIPNTNWTLETSLAAIKQLGWSPQVLSWFFVVLGWMTAAAFCIVGLVVFARKSDSWFGLYVVVMFSVLGTSFGLVRGVFIQAGTFFVTWNEVSGLLAWQFLFVLFYFFPDGHFVPAWTRWLLIAWVGSLILSFLAPSLSGVQLVTVGFCVISTLGSQIYRYFRYSDAIQRQQTRWIVFMVSVLIFLFVPAFGMSVAWKPGGEYFGRNYLISSIISILGGLWLLFFPIVIAIAILKYRLWDIDLIIRRTLVYVPLTAILTGLFAASIKLTQMFLTAVQGQQSETATVLTTLIVVAAFDPLKGWLQRRVDALFKESPGSRKRWTAYIGEVQSFIGMVDAEASARRLLEEATAEFEAKSGRIMLENDGQMNLVLQHGDENDEPMIMIPLEYNSQKLGCLEMGPRRKGRAYEAHDREMLARTASIVAHAIALTRK